MSSSSRNLGALPTHVIQNKIARLLSTRNLAHMAQTSKTSAAVAVLASRREEVEAELRWWARLGAQLLRLPFRAAVARVEGLASGNATAKRRGVRVVETSRKAGAEATALEFKMYGTHFAAEYDVSEVHSRPGRPKHEFTIASRDSLDKGGNHVTLRRSMTTKHGSSVPHTVVKNSGFPAHWARIVRATAAAVAR